MNRVFQIFEEILLIPRESGNESEIANYILNFANKNNCECFRDKFNNIFIKKNNNSNNAIILQAHSDMVCVSNNNFDFQNNGIPFYKDGDFYKSKNTSLGADDGIGIAIILAMLEETENMPNIEVMITVQEETTMIGASNFNYSKLTSKTLIGLDGIKEADIECSSAGMCSLTINKKINYEKNIHNAYKISISGLAGGHSGDDIHKNRCNAIKLVGQLLNKVEYINLIDVNIGIKDNVIPSEGYVIFSCKKELSEIKNILNSLDFKLSFEDSNVRIDVERFEQYADNILDGKDIINFINEVEDGLIEVFEDDNFPLLSSNVGKIKLNKDLLEIKLSIRSSHEEKENIQLNKLQSLCDKFNLNLHIDAKKPFFPYRKDSNIRNLLAKTYRELYSKETVIKKVHACMEGGIISSNIDNLDICTIAPTIDDCHNINEKVSISSTMRVYEWLKNALIKYNKELIISSLEKRKNVMKNYDLIAKQYSRDFGTYIEDLDIYEEFEKHLIKNAKILDLGTGSGRTYSYFIKKGYKYIGLDFSKEMKNCAYKIHGKFPYIVDDMINIKQHFTNDSVDAVFAVYSLFHLPSEDLKKVLSDIYDILKVNGIFLFTYQIGQGEEMVNEPYLNERGKNVLYMNYLTNDKINDLLKLFSYKELYRKEKVETSDTAINSNKITTAFVLVKKIK